MNGPPCVRCGTPYAYRLATTNVWQFYCPACDVRFSAAGDVLAPQHAAVRLQCKDIEDARVLRFLASLGSWATIFSGYENSIERAMPVGAPVKLIRAKMRKLIRRGLVDGCVCGCRGDFELTAKGCDVVAPYAPRVRREFDAVGRPK